MTSREFDIVVYGASGFVGRLLAEYLARTAPPEVRIALAGRSASRVEAVRDQLPGAARDWPVRTADSGEPTALAELAASTRVLATTVGPYARYGLPVVEACARAGTHYADLTGEVVFVREAIDSYHAVATETGARLVHSCGFDSVPSDLAVLLLHEQAVTDGAGELAQVDLLATVRGGFSGGTIDSMRAQVDATRTDAALRKLAADPFALSPDRDAEPDTPQPPDAAPPGRTADGRWTAPFLMAPYNTRIVRRSNALLGWSYGRGLAYGERMGVGRGPRGAVGAAAVTGGLVAMLGAMRLPPTRALVDRLLPAPGDGPSEQVRERGWFRMTVDATTSGGTRYHAVAAGSGDPGYAATAVMLGESALALALDDLPDRAGSLTPAVALGSALVERLRAAGHTYEVSTA